MTPTDACEPDSGESPSGAAAAITSLQRAPAPARATRRDGSTSTRDMRDVFSSRPSSGGTTVPCPVAWTVSGTPSSRDARTAARTSAGPVASTTSGPAARAAVPRALPMVVPAVAAVAVLMMTASFRRIFLHLQAP